MPSESQLAELAHRLRELTGGTDEREAYLKRLATEIREGTYNVDADALAEKLIERLDLSDSGNAAQSASKTETESSAPDCSDPQSPSP